MLALHTLEFDRIVDVITALALTPLGADALAELRPHTDPALVAAALNATSETVSYLEQQSTFSLRGGSGLIDALAALPVEGQLLEPLALRMVADFLESVEGTSAGIKAVARAYPLLAALTARAPGFRDEAAAVRQAIDASGEVLDDASPTLRRLRDQLRGKRQRLRSSLDQFARGKDTSKYLQDQVVTERNGRYVVMVRAEHRGNVPGIVHGSSASGATLFLEPAATVEINNDIVELEEQEREEVLRVLLELTERFRQRADEVLLAAEIATALDVLHAKAQFASLTQAVAPDIAVDGRIELKDARHPLLIAAVRRRLGDAPEEAQDVVPTDILLDPPARVLLITGPNTGGKTVAIKTAGLLVLMAQAGLHVPAAEAKLPVFRSVFADIGDEQSISASLSTFSGHIANIVSMERQLALPALVVLDEVGTGTDPNEGGALATAIISHFKQRGAHVIATTHYDAVKTWGTTTDGVETAAFAFDPRDFAPTYRLIYGAPGRSLAIEIAQRLGLPLPVIAAARGHLSDDQKKVAAHLERIDIQARALDAERSRLQKERRALDETTASVTRRDRELTEREQRLAKRLNEKIDDRVRQAQRDIDAVIEQLKDKSEALVEQAVLRQRVVPGARRGVESGGAASIPGVTTGETGGARAAAREAIAGIVGRLKEPAIAVAAAPPAAATVGARVAVGGLGLEGVVVAIHGAQAEIDVRGKRLKTPLQGLQVVSGATSAKAATAKVRVSVDLAPREGAGGGELNVLGATVEQAVDRIARLIDEALVTDTAQLRIVHGHGTGQLRRGIAAYLKEHPLVAKFYPAPREQGGDGATIVELRE